MINALALGKVVLIAQELHFAEQFQGAPLIYPTLLKSFAFTIGPTCFKIVEEAVIGMLFHGKSFQDSIAAIAGGSWKGLFSFTVLLFVVLIPFFGFTELRRVFGDRLVGAFFRPRHLLNLPPVESSVRASSSSLHAEAVARLRDEDAHPTETDRRSSQQGVIGADRWNFES